MNTVDASCAQCGNAYRAESIMLKDGEPICQPCRIEATSAHRPMIGMVLQAARFAMYEKRGIRANQTAQAFVNRLPEEYQPEAQAIVTYIDEHGKPTPLVALLLKRDNIAAVA